MTSISSYNSGRGLKRKFSGYDVHANDSTETCGKWDFLGRFFRIKRPLYERTIFKFVTLIYPYAYAILFSAVGKEMKMTSIREAQNEF